MIAQKLTAVFKNLTRNQFAGAYAFWVHRITGIIITLFLFLHIWTLCSVFRGKDAYDYAITKFDTKFGYAFQYALLLIVAAHLLNGIRITVVDLCQVTRAQKKLLWASLFLFAVIASVGVFAILL